MFPILLVYFLFSSPLFSSLSLSKLEVSLRGTLPERNRAHQPFDLGSAVQMRIGSKSSSILFSVDRISLPMIIWHELGIEAVMLNRVSYVVAKFLSSM